MTKIQFNDNLEESKNQWIKDVIDYTTRCRCNNGGYCFYRLDEPNGSDTYYALSILKLLGVYLEDKYTVDYLMDMQREDGTYENIYLAYYSIKGLNILGEKPRYNPVDYINSNVKIYNVDSLPVDKTSIFKPLFHLIDLYPILKIEIEGNIRERLIDFILSFRNKDNGFGYNQSTLVETFQAVSILKNLGYPIYTLRAEFFIEKCENNVYGFSNKPGIAPSFIEHIYAGLNISNLLSYKPHYISQCKKFIENCQNNNGGYSRSTPGISTLEDTYYAIHSLKIIEKIS